ncbi:MAG: amidohydrolase [archaeon YNP-LCB-024-027]|nr:amidohydrolase [Candidatus Culexarchaeum yellowstonense]
MNAKDIALKWIEENKDKIIFLSDKIWEYAELGLEEYNSSKLLADTLEEYGFKVKRGIAGMPTAFVAEWGSGKPVIGILGEYDALAGLSQKRVPWKEPIIEGAPGHGCGHNIFGAATAAGAIALKIAMEKCKMEGTIKYFGCPAEETLIGKVFMAREGVFEGLDFAINYHPSSFNTVSLGSTNAMNSAKFHFYGRASHAGGSPEAGRSALDAVELMNIGVNYMREHVIQDARIHYTIEKGGDQPNIVPPYARSWYYVRAPEREQVEEIYNWILDIAKGAALMTQTQHKVEFITGCYNMIQNKTLAMTCLKVMREIGAPKFSKEDYEFAKKIHETIPPEQKRNALKRMKIPDWEKLMDVILDEEVRDPWDEGEVSHGSTDVGDVSWQTPTLSFETACFVLGSPGHSWQNVAAAGVGIGHKGGIYAAKVIAATAIEIMSNGKLIEEAWKEFREKTKGKKYKSPIPPEVKEPPRIFKT